MGFELIRCSQSSIDTPPVDRNTIPLPIHNPVLANAGPIEQSS